MAATEEYTDRITGKLIAPVKTTDIYWGAVPFVCIQIIMVGLIIAFPTLVSSGLGKKPVYDLDKIRREMEQSMRAAEPPPPPPTLEAPGAAAATPDPTFGADNDPMKAMLNSMQRQQEAAQPAK